MYVLMRLENTLKALAWTNAFPCQWKGVQPLIAYLCRCVTALFMKTRRTEKFNTERRFAGVQTHMTRTPTERLTLRLPKRSSLC